MFTIDDYCARHGFRGCLCGQPDPRTLDGILSALKAR